MVPKALGSFEEFIFGAPFFQVPGNSSIGLMSLLLQSVAGVRFVCGK